MKLLLSNDLKKFLLKKGSRTNRGSSIGTKTVGCTNLLLSTGTKAARGNSLSEPNVDMPRSMKNLLESISGCTGTKRGWTGTKRGWTGTNAGWIGTKAGWTGIKVGLWAGAGAGAGRGASLAGVSRAVGTTAATVAGGDWSTWEPE